MMPFTFFLICMPKQQIHSVLFAYDAPHSVSYSSVVLGVGANGVSASGKLQKWADVKRNARQKIDPDVG